MELGDFGNFWLRTPTEGDADHGRPAALQRRQGIHTIEYVKTSEPATVPVEE